MCLHYRTDRTDHRLKRSYLCIFFSQSYLANSKLHSCNNNKGKKAKPNSRESEVGCFLKTESCDFSILVFATKFFFVYLNFSDHGPQAQGLILPSKVDTRERMRQRASSGKQCPASQSHTEVWAAATFQVQSVLSFEASGTRITR